MSVKKQIQTIRKASGMLAEAAADPTLEWVGLTPTEIRRLTSLLSDIAGYAERATADVGAMAFTPGLTAAASLAASLIAGGEDRVNPTAPPHPAPPTSPRPGMPDPAPVPNLGQIVMTRPVFAAVQDYLRARGLFLAAGFGTDDLPGYMVGVSDAVYERVLRGDGD